MKLLILSSRCGNGHHQAGVNICQKLNQIDKIEAKNVDIFDTVLPNFSTAFYKGHDALALTNGYSLIFNAFHKREKSNDLARNAFASSFITHFKELIDNYKPDIIISTYSLVNNLVAFYKNLYRDIPLITWVTDVKVRNFWVNDYINSYIVADSRSKDDLLAMGIDEEKIYIGGIPVSDNFTKIKRNEPSKGQRKKLLVMGGGLGMFPNSNKLFKDLEKLNDINITIVTGKNKSLQKKLKKFENLRVLPFTEATHKLMANSNLLLTKPGGLTIFEAIYSQTPMLLFNPELDQEIYNMKYIVENGCGDVLDENRSITMIQETILDDDKLNFYKNNSMRIKNSIDPYILLKAIKDLL